MHKLSLIVAAVVATIILAPRTSTADHIEPPSRAFTP